MKLFPIGRRRLSYLVGVLLAQAVVLAPASGEVVGGLPDLLSSPRVDAASVWDPTGDRAIVFGGRQGPWSEEKPYWTTWTDSVQAFYPSRTAGSRIDDLIPLPQARCCISAVWDNRTDPYNDGATCLLGCAYLFGGLNAPTQTVVATNEIIRFDPSLRTFTQVGVLPDRRCCTSAVWDSQQNKAYIFFGWVTERSLGSY